MSYRLLSDRDRDLVVASAQGAVLYGRDDLVCLAARGKHHVRFLHALLTAPVEGRSPGDAFAAAATDAQGRVVALCRCRVAVDDAGPRVELWVERPRAAALREHLLAHRVAERLTLEVDDERALVEVIGPGAPDLRSVLQAALARAGDDGSRDAALDSIGRAGAPALPGAAAMAWPLPRLSASVSRDALPALASALLAAGAVPGSHAAQEALRVYAGGARLQTDLHDGSTPWELAAADAVSLQKGCYLGQEALAMQAWRGQLRRALCWLRPEAGATPPPGAALLDGKGRRVGFAGGGVRFADGTAHGLGLVQRKAAAAGTLLRWSGVTASGAGDGVALAAGTAAAEDGALLVVDTVQHGAFAAAAAPAAGERP